MTLKLINKLNRTGGGRASSVLYSTSSVLSNHSNSIKSIHKLNETEWSCYASTSSVLTLQPIVDQTLHHHDRKGDATVCRSCDHFTLPLEPIFDHGRQQLSQPHSSRSSTVGSQQSIRTTHQCSSAGPGSITTGTRQQHNNTPAQQHEAACSDGSGTGGFIHRPALASAPERSAAAQQRSDTAAQPPA
jgi:hypothetical protein